MPCGSGSIRREQGNQNLYDQSEHHREEDHGAHDLPRHPLESQGYASIGCIPCTSRTRPGDDLRSGRWSGRAKTECGIHTMSDGAGI